MKETIDIVPESIVYSKITEKEIEWNGFLAESILAIQISGKTIIETSNQKLTSQAGDMLLIHKHQLVRFIKMPFDGKDYQTITIILNNDVLRRFALKMDIVITERHNDKANIFIPKNEYLTGFFKSLIPYGENLQNKMTSNLTHLKVEEAIELLLHSMPQLKSFLFDFSEPYKIDLENFMVRNYQFNVPIDKFAKLTGRSLAGFKRDFKKAFNMPPRQWLQEKRLAEAHYLIEKKNKKPANIYLELGFESLSHFSNTFKKQYGYTPTQLVSNSPFNN